jgi:hypothetical protein
MAYSRGGRKKLRHPSSHFVSLASPSPPALFALDLLRFSFLSRQTSPPCSPWPIQEGTASNSGPRAFLSYREHHLPLLLHVTYALARISSVSCQTGHPYSSPPTQEWTAISGGPWAIVSCPVHRRLPHHQSRIRSRLNHIRFTSDCTPVFSTAYSRG